MASQFKANGRAWDAGDGAPDLAVCVGYGEYTTCTTGESTADDVTEPACQDDYECRTTLSIADEEPFVVTVIDVDLADNDIVGVGTCTFGEFCQVGLANVTVRRPDSAGARPAQSLSDLVQAIASAAGGPDLVSLRNYLAEDGGEFQVGAGTVASTPDAAIQGWQRNPTLLRELSSICRACRPTEEDGVAICPGDIGDEYRGYFVMFELHHARWQLSSFGRAEL